MNTILHKILPFIISFLSIGITAQTPQDFLNKGRNFHDAKQWQNAFDMYSMALEMQPNSEPALFNRAECAIILKDYRRATEDLNLLLKNNPDDLQAIERRGIAEFYQKNWLAAAQDFSTILGYKEIVDVRLNRASAYLKLDMPEQSHKDLLVCEKYEPSNSRLQAIFGDYFSYKNDYLNAVGYYKKALLSEPNNPEVLNNIGVLEMKKENYRTAEKYFKKAAVLNPDGRIYAHLALAQMNIENFIDAMDNVELALEKNPNESIAYFVKGRFQLENGNYEAAISTFNQAISIDPKYIPAYLQRAKAKRNANKIEESEIDLKKVLELEPGNEEAIDLLGRE